MSYMSNKHVNKLVFLLFVCLLSVQITGPQPENLRCVEEETFPPLHDWITYKFILCSSQQLSGKGKEAMNNYHGNHKTSYLLLPTLPPSWQRASKHQCQLWKVRNKHGTQMTPGNCKEDSNRVLLKMALRAEESRRQNQRWVVPNALMTSKISEAFFRGVCVKRTALCTGVIGYSCTWMSTSIPRLLEQEVSSPPGDR